jgi:hypothetical protein
MYSNAMLYMISYAIFSIRYHPIVLFSIQAAEAAVSELLFYFALLFSVSPLDLSLGSSPNNQSKSSSAAGPVFRWTGGGIG